MAGKTDDGTWPDCGCPLGLGHRSLQIDLTPKPHVCSISKDEVNKHYIFDKAAYARITKAKPDSPLGIWASQRVSQRRLFVVKPPLLPPPPPSPWRWEDEPLPPELPLLPGWRHFEPINNELNISEYYPSAEYVANVDNLFDWLVINDPDARTKMWPTAEAWILACGEIAVARREDETYKVDRVFVTVDMDFFTNVMSRWDKIGNYVKELKLGLKMTHMKRLLDIHMDARVRIGGCGHQFN